MDFSDDERDVLRDNIKCVVVGDTGVGKTRLICAKACNQRLSIDQLMSVHIPTVWAIDQYRTCRKIMEMSYEYVDGVEVSLRLWDTFGDHQTDRRFAYGRSDVVLLCFSIANPRSLKHAKTVWYPEIRRACPHTPIVLVGCKNDLRHLAFQSDFQKMLSERRPFVKNVNCEEILYPESGRLLARDLGAPYYETSVYTLFGVQDLFRNVIRAALCRRRDARFWLTSLGPVERPHLQAPYLPPKPEPRNFCHVPSNFAKDLSLLLCQANFSDVQIRLSSCQSLKFDLHRIILAASSPVFYRLLVCETPNCQQCAQAGHRSQPPKFNLIVSSGDPADTPSIGVSERLQLLNEKDSVVDESSFEDLTLCGADKQPDPQPLTPSENVIRPSTMANSASAMSLSLNHCQHRIGRKRAKCVRSWSVPSNDWPNSHGNFRGKCVKCIHAKTSWAEEDMPPCIQSITLEKDESPSSFGGILSENYDINCPTPVITFSPEVSASSVRLLLAFIYTGQLVANDLNETKATKILKLAKELEIHGLVQTLEQRLGIGSKTETTDFCTTRDGLMAEMGLGLGLFSDVDFCLDDGHVVAHKALLMVRCEMMKAMFSSKFRESHTSVVSIPSVSSDLFHCVLRYLYTDHLITKAVLTLNEFMDLLELANRLCLVHMGNLVEEEIIRQLQRFSVSDETICEDVLHIIEPAQLYNASELVPWCLHYLSVNYNRACKVYPRLIRSLSLPNQECLVKNRWPPVWYLKEYDVYERALKERQQREQRSVCLKRARATSSSGCLCLTKASKRNAAAHCSL